MTYRREWLIDYKSVTGEVVSLGKECIVNGKGTVLVKKLIKGQWKDAKIEDVLYVPQIKKNLFLVSACAKKGYCVTFKDRTVFLKKDNEIQAVGYKQENDIYRLLFKVMS